MIQDIGHLNDSKAYINASQLTSYGCDPPRAPQHTP